MMSTSVRSAVRFGLISLTLGLVGAGSLSAQVGLYLGSAAGDAAGTSGAVTVDFNLDGLPDVALGAPGVGAGYVRISSQIGGIWFDFTGTAVGDSLGADVVSADLNLDGFLDLLVLAPGAGLIYAIDGFGLLGWPAGTTTPITGAPLLWTIAQPSLGTDVEAGDLEGLGTMQVVASSPALNTFYVYNGLTGALLAQRTFATGAYGTSLLIANVDANVGSEIIVADPTAFGIFAWIESCSYAAGVIGVLGAIIPPVNPITGLDISAGTSLVAGADYTGDGFDEVWAGGTANGCGYFIISFNGGPTIFRQYFLNVAGAGFGQSIAVVLDTTGDLVEEYAIGAPGLDLVGVFDGATGALLGTQPDPFGPGGGFGTFLLPIIPGISAGPPIYNMLVGSPTALTIGALWLY